MLSEFTKFADEEPVLEFVQVPFNYPLYILYSSGTTGPPKCMVHSVGVSQKTANNKNINNVIKSSQNEMCSSRSIHTHPTEGLEISLRLGGGSVRPKSLKKFIKLYWNF